MGIGAFSRSHVAHVQSATATTITDTTVTVTTITMTSQMLCFFNVWEWMGRCCFFGCEPYYPLVN